LGALNTDRVVFKRFWLTFAAVIFLSKIVLGENAGVGATEEFISRLSLISSGTMGTVNFDTTEGDFPVINVDPKESFQIALTVPKALVGKGIQIRADDGGVIKGSSDGVFAAVAQGKEGVLKFDYFLGGTTGRYTLKIIAPGYMQVLEFWVGKPRPQASPALSRNQSSNEKSKP
jgi:hypothetical protein